MTGGNHIDFMLAEQNCIVTGLFTYKKPDIRLMKYHINTQNKTTLKTRFIFERIITSESDEISHFSSE